MGKKIIVGIIRFTPRVSIKDVTVFAKNLDVNFPEYLRLEIINVESMPDAAYGIQFIYSYEHLYPPEIRFEKAIKDYKLKINEILTMLFGRTADCEIYSHYDLIK